MQCADADTVWKILSSFLYRSDCGTMGCHSFLKNFRVSVFENQYIQQYAVPIRALTSSMKHRFPLP